MTALGAHQVAALGSAQVLETIIAPASFVSWLARDLAFARGNIGWPPSPFPPRASWPGAGLRRRWAQGRWAPVSGSGALEAGSNEGPVGPDYALAATPHYLNNRKLSIYGGSNEVQKTIIAKAILEL